MEVELHVIREVASRAELPEGPGEYFTTGVAEASHTATLCALQVKCPSHGTCDVSAFDGPPSVYVWKECHLAWLRIAHATGIGRYPVQLIATDGRS